MNKQALVQLLAAAVADPRIAALMQESPEAAAQLAGISLTDDDKGAAQAINAPALQAVSDFSAKLNAVLDQQQQQTGSRGLDALAAILDQQQQQRGTRATLENLAAVLDQQQQQTGSRGLDALAAILDQQQQQGGRAKLENLAALLDQQQQQTGSRGLDALAAILDQQQQQGRTLGSGPLSGRR